MSTLGIYTSLCLILKLYQNETPSPLLSPSDREIVQKHKTVERGFFLPFRQKSVALGAYFPNV